MSQIERETGGGPPRAAGTPSRISVRHRHTPLMAVWLTAAVVLGGALLAAQLDTSPLDDPDLARQRPGFLDALGPPFPAPAVTEAIPSPGRRAVVFFTRPALAPDLRAALQEQSSLDDRAQIVAVVSGETPPDDLPDVPFVADLDGRLAAGFAMPVPRDGGPPVGYAVVDSGGRVRYRTLDPFMDEQARLEEAETIVKATP